MVALAPEIVGMVFASARTQLVPAQMPAADFDEIMASIRPTIELRLHRKLAALPWGGLVRREELSQWRGVKVRVARAPEPELNGLENMEGEIEELRRGGMKAQVRFPSGVRLLPARYLRLAEVAATADEPKPTTVAGRMKANVEALNILAEHGPPFTPDERSRLRKFTGFGGLSIKKVLPLWPPGLPPPSARSLIDEYYTPEPLAAAIAGVVSSRLEGLTDETGRVLALEPAAGIGRLMFRDPRIEWTAVEFSSVSAQILGAVHPDIKVFNEPFERFFAESGPEYFQRLGLLVTNPPYSDNRGVAEQADPDRTTRKLNAAQYFLHRGMELLRPGGLGIYVVPHTVLTGPKSAGFRAQLLRRAHLAAAFRLPSDLFPGAMLVVDVLLLRARGGQLPELSPDDQFIVDGEYFRRFPQHILGVEVEGVGVRRSYQITGSFSGFPSFDERPICDCPAPPFPKAWLRSNLQRRIDEEQLGPETLKAQSLGMRVAEFARREATGEVLDVGAWQAIASELAEWHRNFGNPWDHLEVKQLASTDVDIGRFAGLFSRRGVLSTEWLTEPKAEIRSQPRDLLEVVEELWNRNRRVRLARALEAHSAAGLGVLSELEAAELLERGEWALDFDPDGPTVMPMRHYLAGDMWRRVDAARSVVGPMAGLARRQLDQLMAAIEPLPFAALDDVTPKFSWIPAPMLSEWATAMLGRPTTLRRNDSNMYFLSGLSGEDLDDAEALAQELEAVAASAAQVGGPEPEKVKKSRTDKRSLLVGYLNDDLSSFSPDGAHFAESYGIDTRDWEDEEKKKTLPSLTQVVREKMAAEWSSKFKAWLGQEDARRDFYTEGWNRRFKGWKVPEYPREQALPVGWSDAIQPHWWQHQGAARMIDQRGGLCAFDVGLGKTLTAILLIALGKERGLMRRPVIVVPNTVTWQWEAEIKRALPHFRVGVVGSKLVVKADNRIVDLNDEPEERAAKWLAFQRGLYDVVLVTATAFPRVAVDTVALEPFYRGMSDFLRFAHDTKEALKATRKALLKKQGFKIEATDEEGDGEEEDDDEVDQEDDGDDDDDDSTGKKPRRWTERDEARANQDLGAFLGELNELPPRQRADPGVIWDALGVDCLIVDEAQRYKGLFTPPAIDGSIPKFMGSAQASSKRAWQLHSRAASVRQKNGDTGVYLLSATPAKNSPLEFYNAYCYISSDVWAERGITTHLAFVNRFCDFGFVQTLSTKLEPTGKMALVGFKHLDELRAVLLERATFYNAEQVGLPLPTPDVVTIEVDMSVRQLGLYEVEVDRLRDAIKLRKKSDIFRALANMSLIATHPDLIDRVTKRTKKGPVLAPAWNWGNAQKNTRVRSAKFDRCAAQVMAQPNCNHLIFVQSVAAQAWFREVLVALGMPREQILVMNAKTAARPAQRRNMALAFTGSEPAADGDVAVAPTHRILIANETAYEGVNLQRLTCAVHHLDIPWEPATLQQRNGRAVRQGNRLDVVGIYYYLARGSSDGLRFAAITGKLRWMDVLIAGTDRETNNPAAQQEMSASELTLALARDPQKMAGMQALLQAESQKEAMTKTVKQLPRAVASVRGYLEEAARAEPVEAARMRAAARETWDEVKRVAPDRMRHQLQAAARVIYSRPVQVVGATLVWPGLVVRLDGGLVELGRSTDTELVFRREGSATWERHHPRLLSAWEVVVEDDEAVLKLPLDDGDFDLEVADDGLDEALRRHVHRHLALGGDWRRLGWQDASEEFREKAWPVVGQAVVERVRVHKGTPLPAVREGLLRLETGENLVAATVLPWTESGYETAARTALGEQTRVTDVVQTAREYWGRAFRRTRDVGEAPTEELHPALTRAEGALREKGYDVVLDGTRLGVARDGMALGVAYFAGRLRWEATPGPEPLRVRYDTEIRKELRQCCDLSRALF